MLNRSNLHHYQEHCVSHILKHPASALLLEMGLGKTISVLTAIDQLMFVDFEVNKTLVIAPKRVAQDTWTREVEDWAHVRHLQLSLVLGTERQRKEALLKKADIYVINRDNVIWLVAHYGTGWPFDMVVLDEISSFKSQKSKRFKALRSVRPYFNRVVGLTGTPAPNSLIDLWPQLYLLDQGERLGKTIGEYRRTYFDHSSYGGGPDGKYSIKIPEELVKKKGDKKNIQNNPNNPYAKAIYNKIGDICISMKAKDYLKLPGRIERVVPVVLSSENLKKYREFEEEQVLQLEDIEAISAVNAAALTTKLLQYANGAVYDADKNYHEVHNEKLEALEEIVEAANGKPVLVFYSYKHDVERIKKHLKAYKPEELQGSAHIKQWNEKKVSLLLCHPASAGHGLNMQAGGNIIVWFGLPWSLELYEQANARLDRQGQNEVVIIHRLLTKDTMDEDVLKALDRKATGQNALMEAVKARIKKYVK